MIRGLYSIRDEASGLYMSVQVSDTDDVAMRSFDFACRSHELMQFKPEDFSLWRVASWDDVTGVVTGVDPILVKRGVKRGKG